MTMDGEVRLTILNSMAGGELPEALDRHVRWGIDLLDLKDGLFGAGVLDLTDEQAGRVAEMARQRGLEVHCLSTGLFHDDVERGEAHFRHVHLQRVDRAIEIARILGPRFVRLLAAWSTRRGEFAGCDEYTRAECPWLTGLYGEAVDRIAEAGFAATIENEVGQCILRTPREATSPSATWRSFAASSRRQTNELPTGIRPDARRRRGGAGLALLPQHPAGHDVGRSSSRSTS
jgi:sugar phosphate isomerase/epimerase